MTVLTPTSYQLSATLQAWLISLTANEVFCIVNATERQGIEAWRQLGKRFDLQTDARVALLLISLVAFKLGKGQDVQLELVRWESMLLSLECDHAGKLSPTIRRALLLSILPTALQPRILEHVDRLADYDQVRDKVVSLVQTQRNPDAMDTNMVYGEDNEAVEEAAEGCTEEEEAMGLAALADVVCRRCNKRGHFARNSKTPPPAFSPAGKSKGKGTKSMSTYGGRGGAAPLGPLCPGCGKLNHTKEKCWGLHPELAPPKNRTKDLGSVIRVCAIEVVESSKSPSPSSSSGSGDKLLEHISQYPTEKFKHRATMIY